MASRTEVVWAVPPTIWAENFQRYSERLRQALEALCDFFAPQIEAWMKHNAPWTDRTGNARAGLRAQTFQVLTDIGILILHRMDYGIWLELANGGRYSILQPALNFWGPRLFSAVRKLVA